MTADEQAIPVLTLWQPWATLVACGMKRIETRSWSTNYRGRLAIHAAARSFGIDSDTAEVVRSFDLSDWQHLGQQIKPGRRVDPEMGENYPRGAVIATAELVDVIPMVVAGEEGAIRTLDIDDNGSLWITEPVEDEDNDPQDWREVTAERPFGDYRPGRFAWLLEDIRRLPEPVPFKGGQGLTRKVALNA